MTIPRTIVALPARDEEARLGACLGALLGGGVRPDAVVVLLNNCGDGSAAVAEGFARAGAPVRVVRRVLPPALAHAGHARRLAMEAAAALGGADAVLLTTDADGVVEPGWLGANLAAIGRGADAVCGQAVIDPVEALLIPAHLHEDDAREVRLVTLLDEIASWVDPDAADPWPRHTEASGASLAVRAGVLRAVGGVPALAGGEDRALVDALVRADARVRHDCGVRVVVSGRVEGRAAGGMADAIRRRMVRQDALTDERVEPARLAWRRVRLRARARAVWAGGGDAGLDAALGLGAGVAAGVLRGGAFGAGWARVEALAPRLARRRVAFAALEGEIAVAARLLAGVRGVQLAAAE